MQIDFICHTAYLFKKWGQKATIVWLSTGCSVINHFSLSHVSCKNLSKVSLVIFFLWYTVKPRYNEPLHNEVLGKTNDLSCFSPVIVKYNI